MSLGILNNISAIYAENNLNNTQSSLQKVLQQLSSGARINSGADDAAGLAIADGLHANEAALTQSQQNANNGIGLLQTADGALSQINGLLDRAVTLATEAANGGLTASEVSSANQEYQSIIGEIGSIGSTTNFNGVNVFGTAATAFYVGDGTSSGSNFYSDTVGALTINSVGLSAPVNNAPAIAAPSVEAHVLTTLTSASAGVVAVNGTAGPTAGTVTIALGSANDSVATATANTISVTSSLQNGGAAVAVTITAGSTIASAVAQLNANTTFATGFTAAQGSGANANKIIITDKTSGVDGISAAGTSLTDTSAVAGVQTYQLTNTNDTLSGTLVFNQGTRTASLSLAPGTTLAQAITAVNASGSSFQQNGITATAYVAGATTLTLTNTNSANTNFGQVSNNTGTTLTDNQSTLVIATPTIVNSSAVAGSTATFAALQTTSDDILGTLKVQVGTAGTPITVQFQAGTTLSQAVTQLNNNAQFKAANIIAGINGSNQLVLTGPAGTSSNPTGNTLTTTGSVLYDTPPVAAPTSGTDFTSNALSSLTTTGAQAVLTGVNAAIQNVAYQRGVIGAYNNILTAASNTAASENVNLTSAENSIRSTNYGEATSDLAKYEVLSQTGISALAQANSVQQEILKLLQ